MRKHLCKLLLLAMTLVMPLVTQGQSLGEYTFATGTDTTKWIDVPTSLTSLISPGAGDYGVSTVQDFGFSFPFGEDSYTQFSVNADGNLRLGPTVTGTANYTTPFSSSNANINNPKINFFGCDGFCTNDHYVRYLHTVDANNDSVGVVEFCTGTYNSTTRSNLYRWQVQLYHNGNIVIVYGPAPNETPNVEYHHSHPHMAFGWPLLQFPGSGHVLPAAIFYFYQRPHYILVHLQLGRHQQRFCMDCASCCGRLGDLR